MRQVEKERLVFMLLDEVFGFGGQAVGQVLAGRSGVQPRHEPAVALKGRKVTERRARVIAGDVQVKALSFRPESRATQMPLADMSGGVAGRLQGFGKRRLFERQ